MKLNLNVSVLEYAEAIIRATLKDYPDSARHLEYAQTFLKPPTDKDIGWNWIRERAAA
jgi:hypothetical protein